MSEAYNQAIFWIEVDKIKPNPFQPRREFDEDAMRALADSIRQYGVLQPLVVTRREVAREDGGLATEYELIAGERRWRAARLAGLSQIPALIREDAQSDRMKLEMAIIENLQREDLNVVDRARAFRQLAEEFAMKHTEIAKRIGKSREYVSNSIRIMNLPEEMLQALMAGQINEGHTRPILMLAARPGEQKTLFQEIIIKKMNVRDAENIARRIAFERVRKTMDPELVELEQQLTDKLGNRVKVERKEKASGGRVMIDFFDSEGLQQIIALLAGTQTSDVKETTTSDVLTPEPDYDDPDLYNLKNFSI
ncbi:MAG: ParB/RepB/Spo0J family partition protein [Candidatus Vogelbacteria bacterium]|nr:ParB/RepB/Spo0J family partition protein [Candidatus Vogelbacteria bacterium]